MNCKSKQKWFSDNPVLAHLHLSPPPFVEVKRTTYESMSEDKGKNKTLCPGSLTRDQACTPCVASAESQPLNLQKGSGWDIFVM